MNTVFRTVWSTTTCPGAANANFAQGHIKGRGRLFLGKVVATLAVMGPLASGANAQTVDCGDNVCSTKVTDGALASLTRQSTQISTGSVGPTRLRLSQQAVQTQPMEAGQANAMSLDAVAEQAAMTHASVASRRSAVNAADAEQDAAWQQYLPTPSVQAQQGSGGRRGTVFSLQQPLWTGGRIRAGVAAAKARAGSARFSVAETQQGLAFSAAAAFEDFAQARGRQEVLSRFLERLERYRVSMQRRVDSGASPASDLELVRARQSTALVQFNEAKAAEEVALAQLSQLVGSTLHRSDLVTDLPVPALPSIEEAVAQAERFSPTLQRMTQDIEASRGDAAVRRAAMWPTVSLVAEKGMAHGTVGHTDSTTVMLQLQYTPGAGLSARSQAVAAEAQVEAIRANREAARSDLESRVRSEYENVRAATERQAPSAANAKAAANVLASYERLFIAGKRSWQEVMNAARDLSDADIAMADLTAQRAVGRYRLGLFDGEPTWMVQVNE